MLLSCKNKLFNNENPIDIEDIFNQIKTSCDVKTINYGLDVYLHEIFKNNNKTIYKYKIQTDGKIDIATHKNGIYFILDYELKHLLYIGKSQDVKDRLKQHLIECASTTNSHIIDVYEYLLQRKAKSEFIGVKY